MNYLPYFEKRFVGKTIESNGYKYEFLGVKFVDDKGYVFKVNTITPVPDGGYLLPKIYDDVKDLVTSFMSYMGKQSVYVSLHILVNGINVDGSYIPYELLEKTAQEITLLAGTRVYRNQYKSKKEMKLSLKFKPRKVAQEFFEVTDDQVTIFFKYDVLKIEFDGVEYKPISKNLIYAADFIEVLVWEDETLLQDMDNTIYTNLNPQLQITSDDFYYSASYRISSILGKPFRPLTSKDKEFPNDLFEPI